MTNEEYVKGLGTKRFAEWIAKEIRRASLDYYHENQKGWWKTDFWEKWLKEEKKYD